MNVMIVKIVKIVGIVRSVEIVWIGDLNTGSMFKISYSSTQFKTLINDLTSQLFN